MTDHFSTFGIDKTFFINREQLERRFHVLQAASHPDRHIDAPEEDKDRILERSSEINQAYRVLRDPIPRTKHLLSLYGYSVHEKKKVPQALLMTVMEVQEKIAELESIQDTPSRNRIKRELTELSEGFTSHIARLTGETALLTSEWDQAPHSNDALEFNAREQGILGRLAEILAERSYVETLQHSVRAAEAGTSAVVRH